MNHLGCEISGTDDQFLPEVNNRHVRAVPNQHIQESEAGTACDTFQNELGANCQLQDRSGTWKGRLRSSVLIDQVHIQNLIDGISDGKDV